MLPVSVDDITTVRVYRPEMIAEAARRRRRRGRLSLDGRLCVVAADHPARLVTAVGADRLGMADRADFLGRVWRVIAAMDGVMATMDVLQDLLVIDALAREKGAKPALDGKLLLASINRGGLAGSAWELDDPTTAATAETCTAWHLDGAKLLLRVCLEEALSLRTLQGCAAEITRMNAAGLPTFLEPLPVRRSGDKWQTEEEAEPLARLVGVASALGDSSHLLWLKLPWVPDFRLVARATTLPILLLGGPAAGSASPLFDQLADAMRAGGNVRGALVGRNVLYPGGADPLDVARRVNAIVRGTGT